MLYEWFKQCFSQRLRASAGEKDFLVFTRCSTSAGEEQKKYRAEAQRRRGKKEPCNVNDVAFLSVSAPLREKRICQLLLDVVALREAQTGRRMTEKKPVPQGQETKYLLLLGKDLGFVTQEDYNRLQDRCDNVGKLFNGLINSLKA